MGWRIRIGRRGVDERRPGPDPDDPATASAHVADYLAHLTPEALAGARIGIPRNGWFGASRTIDSAMTGVIATLGELGAIVVDDIALEINPNLRSERMRSRRAL